MTKISPRTKFDLCTHGKQTSFQNRFLGLSTSKRTYTQKPDINYLTHHMTFLPIFTYMWESKNGSTFLLWVGLRNLQYFILEGSRVFHSLQYWGFHKGNRIIRIYILETCKTYNFTTLLAGQIKGLAPILKLCSL